MRRLVVVTAVVAALTIVASPAQAATTDFNVNPGGVYGSPTTAFITGKAICDGGTGTITFANTPQRPPPPVINGETAVVCDGGWHDYAATLTGGPFFPNQILVFQGALVAPSGTVNHPAFKVVLR